MFDASELLSTRTEGSTSIQRKSQFQSATFDRIVIHYIARAFRVGHMSKTHRALEAIVPKQRVAPAPTSSSSGF
jgi:hypothetical protein